MSIADFLKNLVRSRTAPMAARPDADLDILRRKCWTPEVRSGDGALTGSKFSGIPYLAGGEKWPTCPNCGNPIQLFVQLNSEELPDGSGRPWGDGLLQIFYCTNGEPMCEVDCQAWGPYSKSTVLRIIAPGHNASEYSESPVPKPFRPRQILGWLEKDDFPNWEELKEYAVEITEDEQEKLSESYPVQGEKLWGWPLWVQGIEYPNCPKCDTRMQLLFQVDSNQNIPYDFGDVGVGHICHCPEHRTELAFGWACY